MTQPDLALRTTRNGLFSHYVVAGSKNPLPLGMGSVNVKGAAEQNSGSIYRCVVSNGANSAYGEGKLTVNK